jgi:hypothetical protein
MADYDSPWKEALDVFFEAFLKLFFPQIHADVDWSRGWESLDKELQQIAPETDVGRRYVDKLVKVWLKNGDERWMLIHIEVQMTDESNFAWRMYVYHCRLLARYNRVVMSLAVLGDDNPQWRPDQFVHERWGMEVAFRFPVVKLLEYAERRRELEESDNAFATVILAHLDTQETRENLGQRKDRKFALVKGLMERGWDAEKVRQLFRLVDWLMTLPKPLEKEYWQQVTRYQKEKQMPYITTPERIEMERVLAKAVEKVLRLRFPEESSQLMSEIRQNDPDYEQLEQILDAAETASGPDELRKLWSNSTDSQQA